ncbi:MAG TPA: hypothetical protein PLV86_09015 [Candidatus Fermentibacter daniensis]|nr:hypothetical protein [Candidatus Fermentibacter daniensis]HOY89848.1 hypothetical protein [Bacillota bacterium]HQM41880.1 hypothetical protein [Candidatus Fermentibacter daniensis]
MSVSSANTHPIAVYRVTRKGQIQMPTITVRVEQQLNPVSDEVSALTAVVRPILEGVLFSVKQQVINQVGGYDRCTLEMLARTYRPGDGDCGLCFEYAIHDALRRSEASITERIHDAMSTICRVPGNELSSILFGLEKNGAVKVIDTAMGALTDESALMYGTRGRPARLKQYISYMANAFRQPRARAALPSSISGLWKADLFLGHIDTDKWVGTTVKINPNDLKGAKGLRIGITPSREGSSDRVRMDETRNLVICPVPYDHAFMEVFYQAWGIVRLFLAADANLPREVALPRPSERQVARYLADRRSYPVRDVIEALGSLAQPGLLETDPRNTTTSCDTETVTGTIEAPVARIVHRP